MQEEARDKAEMVAHYESGVEKQRLDGAGRLEFIRTMEILDRHLPQPPAVIADIGGGPGAYALPLAGRGFEVHLLDPIALHLEQARQASTDPQTELASTTEGDARELPYADQSIDVALLLGPLYHLTLEADRYRALGEARRVLKPDGLIAVAAVSRFASTYDGLARGLLLDPEFEAIVERDLRDGQHRNPDRHPDWFTSAFFHRPDELAQEVEQAGFQLLDLLGVEGPAGWLPVDSWLDDDRRERLLEAIRRVEAEPSLLGASAHLLAIGRK